MTIKYYVCIADDVSYSLIYCLLNMNIVNSDEIIKYGSLQLNKELRNGHVFDGWKEGIINFAPTYKYEIDSDRYVGQNPREGEKKRSPAW